MQMGFREEKRYCIDSNYGKSNVTGCTERWGSNAYKIKLYNIKRENRGYTSKLKINCN